jgi:pimeloyl-ACP methyl ester carboxylesterase
MLLLVVGFTRYRSRLPAQRFHQHRRLAATEVHDPVDEAIENVVEWLHGRLTLFRDRVARQSVTGRLSDEHDMDAAGQLLVDLEDLADGAVLPVGGDRASVLENQAVLVDPLVRRLQVGHKLLRSDELPVLRELLPQIQTPVQIVAGARDPAVPPVNAEFLHERLPKSKLDILDAGHFTWEDAADEYAALVTSWWSGGYAAAGSSGAP